MRISLQGQPRPHINKVALVPFGNSEQVDLAGMWLVNAVGMWLACDRYVVGKGGR